MTQSVVELEEYLRQRNRPEDHPVMAQEWYDLLFAHYSVDADVLRRHLPKELEIDTFPDHVGRERAWIGVVPFGMRNIRPRALPALPWISHFLEANVRTYVHRQGRDPGVWFFSLDAARWIACAIARATFHLPYHHATMHMDQQGGKVEYQTRRRSDGAALHTTYTIGEDLTVLPGSFEFWLVERYRLFAMGPRGLMTGMVSHAPYPLQSVTVSQWSTTLPEACGLPNDTPSHVVYSPGVSVEVFAARLCS